MWKPKPWPVVEPASRTAAGELDRPPPPPTPEAAGDTSFRGDPMGDTSSVLSSLSLGGYELVADIARGGMGATTSVSNTSSRIVKRNMGGVLLDTVGRRRRIVLVRQIPTRAVLYAAQCGHCCRTHAVGDDRQCHDCKPDRWWPHAQHDQQSAERVSHGVSASQCYCSFRAVMMVSSPHQDVPYDT